MQILGLSGMYFDAVVVEVEKSLHFSRLALWQLLVLDYIKFVCFSSFYVII